jgi:hypothetical protein
VLAAVTLAACGSEEGRAGADRNATAPGPSPSAGAAAKPGGATAEQVAAEARGRLRCPSSESGAAGRADGAPADSAARPVDDILGVRGGQTLEDARVRVLCSHPLLVATETPGRGFEIATYGQTLRQGFEARFAKPRVERSSQQIMKDMQDEAMGRGLNRRQQDVGPGQSKWYVGTLGMPGEERVISVAREEWFEADRQPTVASVLQALAGKYGPPVRTMDSGAVQLLGWSHDAQGRRLAEGAPLYAVCRGNPSPDAPTNLLPDCGLTIEAAVHVSPSNPGLAQSLQVSIVDQARVWAVHEATTQGLERQEAARRADQVKDAAKTATAPQL